MKASKLYMPTLREDPKESSCVSHSLLIRASMIRPSSAGIYTYLPLGLRVINNISKIVREEMNAIDACEILMPALQPDEIWKTSKRWDEYGELLFKLEDQSKRNFCLGPTHEEVITSLIAGEVKSYKQLPLSLYQIQTKFRDELRSKSGLLRLKELIMKDAYSFHSNPNCLDRTYNAMYSAYCKIFDRIGIKYVTVEASNGSMGGSVSHEFQAISDVGEDKILVSKDRKSAFNTEVKAEIEDINNYDEFSSIEIGHIFKLGDRYSKIFNAQVTNDKREKVDMLMGCYGIGISRLMAVMIEQNHDDRGIIWNPNIAPFKAVIIATNYNTDAKTKELADSMYDFLDKKSITVILDDREERIGVSLKDFDLIGIPHRFVLSLANIENNIVTYKNRSKPEEISVNIQEINEYIDKTIDLN